MAEVKFYKVNSLPASLKPDAWYLVENGNYAETYVTNSSSVAKYVGNSTMINELIAAGSIVETDPLFTAWLATPPDLSEFNDDIGFLTTETDPIWLADKPSYLTSAIAATTYSPLGHTHTFASITSKPTTLLGYGITDAYPLVGNPSGFLTSYIETDPIYSASSWFSTTNNSTNWDTAFGWGNHASAGYLTVSKKDDFLLAQQAMGSPIKVEPIYGIKAMTNTFVNMTNGRIYAMACYIDRTTTANGVIWYQGVQGIYTAGAYNGVGLFSYDTSSGTMTLVASSTDDGNIWKATPGWNQKAFSSPVVIGPGLYFMSALFTSGAITTAPSINSMTTTVQGSAILPTNGAKLYGTLTSTSFPASQAISTITAGFPVALGLY